MSDDDSSMGRALKRVPMWDAINRFAFTGANSVDRQLRVVEVERAVDALLADQLADAQRTAAQAVARVRELEGEVAYVREHTLPLPLTPWHGQATGNDIVDRLRGIYIMPVIGERRFGASAINLEAAARLEECARLTASAAGKAADRG